MIESEKIATRISTDVKHSDNFDAIIIGGGIMGCCTAYELVQRGLSVAVIDKGTIGDNPSGKSSAIIRQHYSNELTARMAFYSLSIFQNFNELTGEECGFTNTGFLLLVDAKDRLGLEANISLQRRLGIRTELLQPESVLELMPGLDISDQVTAAFEPDSGYADPYLTVTSFARAAQRMGAVLYQDTRVLELYMKGGRVTGVKTQRGEFNAPIVINCAGAWGSQIAVMAGVHAPINSCRVQVAFFRKPDWIEESHPVVADFSNATYFRSETGAITLVGLIDPGEAKAVVNPDDYKEYMDDAFLLDAGERLIARFPDMQYASAAGGYASLYAITPDWHPIVDQVPSGSGLFICSGFSGHGFKLGPAIGLMMADLVTGSAAPRFDPHLFRFSRFVEGDPVRGGYEYSIVG